jgi:hypothetical protein
VRAWESSRGHQRVIAAGTDIAGNNGDWKFSSSNAGFSDLASHSRHPFVGGLAVVRVVGAFDLSGIPCLTDTERTSVRVYSGWTSAYHGA